MGGIIIKPAMRKVLEIAGISKARSEHTGGVYQANVSSGSQNLSFDILL